MDFSIETKISNFIENQFPSFYRDEGRNFVLFMKAYYEWLESSQNPIYHSRNLLNYSDIDNTLESFLEYFQKKYIYGVPSNVIINKRFLVKHILDVYRSKSSIQGYKLLFRMLYNEDLEVYLPGRDILRASDGTWIEPKYLEVTYSNNLSNLIEKEIQGVLSSTTAVVENYITESYNSNILNTLFISNVSPKKGSFLPGEKIVLKTQISNTQAILQAPTVIGSLNTLEIINGGQGFSVGNIIKIAKRQVSNTSNVISFGENGFLRVSNTARAFGSIYFDINNGGSGFTVNSSVFIYKGDGDTTGNGASFDIGSVSDVNIITYNTDLILNYANLAIDSSSYGLPGNTSANQSTALEDCLSYDTNSFGKISSLTNIETGNSYTNSVTTFVRTVLTSNGIEGSVSYDTTSNTITGTTTIFDSIFANNDVIGLQANTSNNDTIEYQVIKEVTNSTQIILYSPPNNNSTASAIYTAAPTILPANFAPYENIMVTEDGSIVGENENILGLVSSGNDVISSVEVLDSGKGYVEGELVYAYLQGGLNTPTILTSGTNYVNGELIVFSGGGTTSSANGFITTNANGSITSLSLTDQGSGYTEIPNIRIKSANGSGATFTTTINEFNTVSTVIGRVRKKGIGVGRGYWSTTRGHLNSDKYIQDSYYYQDYSYELEIAKSFDKYKDIIYQSFHIAGSELFGKYLKINVANSLLSIDYSNNTPETTNLLTLSYLTTVDTTNATSDTYLLTADIS